MARLHEIEYKSVCLSIQSQSRPLHVSILSSDLPTYQLTYLKQIRNLPFHILTFLTTTITSQINTVLYIPFDTQPKPQWIPNTINQRSRYMAIKYPTNPLKFGLARNFIHRYQCRLQGLDQSQRYLRIREKVRERGSESFTGSHYVTFPFLDPLSLSLTTWIRKSIMSSKKHMSFFENSRRCD